MRLNSVHQIKEYGNIAFVIRKVMDKNQITPYQLSKATGLKHKSIKDYYDNKPLSRIDFDVLSRLCSVLECDITDIIKYNKR